MLGVFDCFYFCKFIQMIQVAKLCQVFKKCLSGNTAKCTRKMVLIPNSCFEHNGNINDLFCWFSHADELGPLFIKIVVDMQIFVFCKLFLLHTFSICWQSLVNLILGREILLCWGLVVVQSLWCNVLKSQFNFFNCDPIMKCYYLFVGYKISTILGPHTLKCIARMFLKNLEHFITENVFIVCKL